MPNRMDIHSSERSIYRIAIEDIGQGDVSRITEISMVDVTSGEEIATVRVSPVGWGESVTVSLDLLSENCHSLTFIVDSTSKVFELDKKNNSSDVSALDVMTHDINLASITVAVPTTSSKQPSSGGLWRTIDRIEY